MVVREDSLTLFGFLDEDEKAIFELVQTAQRRRPQAGAGDARRARARRAAPCAVAGDDVKTLTTGPRHRPEGRAADHPRAQGPARRARRPRQGRYAAPARPQPWRDQVHQGLVGLGWSAREADARRRRRRARGRRRRPDVGDAAARGPADAEQGLTMEPSRRPRRPTRPSTSDADRGRGRGRRARRRGGAAAAHPRRGHRPGAGPRAARPGARGGPRPRPRARPRAALRPARARQDHAGDDHRRRDERPAAADQRPGDHPRRRPGRDPLRA